MLYALCLLVPQGLQTSAELGERCADAQWPLVFRRLRWVKWMDSFGTKTELEVKSEKLKVKSWRDLSVYFSCCVHPGVCLFPEFGLNLF